MSQFCRVQVMGQPCLHFTVDRLDSIIKIQENSADNEEDKLSKYLEYFADFTNKKINHQ